MAPALRVTQARREEWGKGIGRAQRKKVPRGKSGPRARRKRAPAGSTEGEGGRCFTAVKGALVAAMRNHKQVTTFVTIQEDIGHSAESKVAELEDVLQRTPGKQPEREQ
ncbi:hypothetical protein NDU88_008132 [Pleurodeles waltl]|uniref:Uncharacterized protein n=1 Tax=Pleurodeles waltl TaxID=8319 RepID=A0AAV7U5N5_PLEWA|nr:hypothetical protein NDU88_008132 [Pleurodeles waltl]